MHLQWLRARDGFQEGPVRLCNTGNLSLGHFISKIMNITSLGCWGIKTELIIYVKTVAINCHHFIYSVSDTTTTLPPQTAFSSLLSFMPEWNIQKEIHTYRPKAWSGVSFCFNRKAFRTWPSSSYQRFLTPILALSFSVYTAPFIGCIFQRSGSFTGQTPCFAHCYILIILSYAWHVLNA